MGHAITQLAKDGYHHFVDDISSFDSYRVSRGLTHLAALAPGAGRAALEGLGALGKVRLFDRAVVGGEGLATRQRVLANIADSRAARDVSNFSILAAKEDQILGGYNPDSWRMTTLRKGEIVFGGLPGQSNFYTTLNSVLDSGGNKEALGRILQVEPHPAWGYRDNIGEYIIARDIRIPGSIIQANTHLGEGNGYQFFINKRLNLIKLSHENDLEKFHEINMPRNQCRY